MTVYRKQEPGDNIAAHLTELRTIAKNCQHEDIAPVEIPRDRIFLEIRDHKIYERLLRWYILDVWEHISYRLYLNKLYLPFILLSTL